MTGPFVVMIYEMIAGDILTFASIYIVLLLGFSQGFFYLYKNAATDVTTMNSYWEAFLLSFQMTLGEFKARVRFFFYQIVIFADVKNESNANITWSNFILKEIILNLFII